MGAEAAGPAAGARRQGGPIVLASVAVAVALLTLVTYDSVATRRELLALLRQHALALRETLAAAARSNQASAALSAARLGERLLEQARALGTLDRAGRLRQQDLDEVAARDPLIAIGVFAADGARERFAGRGPVPGSHHGGPGRAPGMSGHGRGGGVGLARRVLAGEREVVTGVHGPRWGGAERVAAGVRRAAGGAIVVTVDASDEARLQRPASLESMLEEITRSSPEIAYTVFEHEGGRLAFGDIPPVDDAPGAAGGERERQVGGRSVLELSGDVPIGGETARLRLGMRLDDVRRLERRMTVRLFASVVAASALVALAFGLAGLGRRYGALSRRHAHAQEALRRRDRLAAMGELASTVAHEVRNPLNAVGMTAQRLRREFLGTVAEGAPERAELEDLLGVMSAETARIDRIVQQFLDYARPPRLSPEPTDLPALVQTLVERTRPLAESRGVALGTDLPSAGRAQVDAALLRQALDNLVRNAIEATPEGGRVDVATRCEADGCVIEVKDTGCGIAPEHLPRVFDLYFTTKPEGTGVGLAITQQIVTAHGGTIEVDSAPGRGTTMTVRLPVPTEADRG
jgi:signal transduction histidine kinase